MRANDVLLSLLDPSTTQHEARTAPGLCDEHYGRQLRELLRAFKYRGRPGDGPTTPARPRPKPKPVPAGV